MSKITKIHTVVVSLLKSLQIRKNHKALLARYTPSLTVVDARYILDPAKIPLISDTYAVVLIREVQTYRGVVVERFYLAGNPGEVLKTALLGSVDRTALYLRDTDFPRSRKRSTARDKCQCDRVTQSDTRVHVHCENYSTAHIEHQMKN